MGRTRRYNALDGCPTCGLQVCADDSHVRPGSFYLPPDSAPTTGVAEPRLLHPDDEYACKVIEFFLAPIASGAKPSMTGMAMLHIRGRLALLAATPPAPAEPSVDVPALLAAARRTAYLESAKAICSRCRCHGPPTERSPQWWVHEGLAKGYHTSCSASAIYALAAREEM